MTGGVTRESGPRVGEAWHGERRRRGRERGARAERLAGGSQVDGNVTAVDDDSGGRRVAPGR